MCARSARWLTALGLALAACTLAPPAAACTYFPGYITIAGVAVPTPAGATWTDAAGIDLLDGEVSERWIRLRPSDPADFLADVAVGTEVADLSVDLMAAADLPRRLYSFGAYTLTLARLGRPLEVGPWVFLRGSGWFEGDGYRTKTNWDLTITGDRYVVEVRGAPEPGAVLLLVAGLGGVVLWRRRHRSGSAAGQRVSARCRVG